MKQYTDKNWRKILAFNGLDSFQKIWDLDIEWFEEPNMRRSGWSGVSKLNLKLPAGGVIGVFLKRQENYNAWALHHPVDGVPTFLREYNNLLMFKKHDIPTLDVVCFKSWREGGQQRAILMTEELKGYIPLSSAVVKQENYFSNISNKKVFLKKLALVVRKMHSKGLMHNCLYPKHIFAKYESNGEPDFRFIDLEKAKSPIFRNQTIFRDLFCLNRRSKEWSIKDKIYFYKNYCGEKKLSRTSRILQKKIHNRTMFKQGI